MFYNLKTPGYQDDGAAWLKRGLRQALSMARAYSTADRRHLRVIWQERAADYRETLIDHMRRRAGWTLAERVAGKREG